MMFDPPVWLLIGPEKRPSNTLCVRWYMYARGNRLSHQALSQISRLGHIRLAFSFLQHNRFFLRSFFGSYNPLDLFQSHAA